jgi:hypothetical protein
MKKNQSESSLQLFLAQLRLQAVKANHKKLMYASIAHLHAAPQLGLKSAGSQIHQAMQSLMLVQRIRHAKMPLLHSA